MNESSTAMSQSLRLRRTALVQTLEELWQQGQQPDPVAFLQAQATSDPQEITAVLAFDQFRRWHAGERVSAEEYLERFPALTSEPDTVLQMIRGEFLVRRELGEEPAATEYLERFASCADVLVQYLTLQQAVQPTGPVPDPCQTEDGARAKESPGAAAVAIDPFATTDAQVADPNQTRTEAGSSHRVAPFPDQLSLHGYEILGKLGQGAMGVVYKARQRALNRIVALKMIK